MLCFSNNRRNAYENERVPFFLSLWQKPRVLIKPIVGEGLGQRIRGAHSLPASHSVPVPCPSWGSPPSPCKSYAVAINPFSFLALALTFFFLFFKQRVLIQQIPLFSFQSIFSCWYLILYRIITTYLVAFVVRRIPKPFSDFFSRRGGSFSVVGLDFQGAFWACFSFFLCLHVISQTSSFVFPFLFWTSNKIAIRPLIHVKCPLGPSHS